MCGIAGIWGAGADPRSLEEMVTRLAHRGPDGRGLWIGGLAALGHTRLALVDPEGGGQPLSNEDGRVTAVLNGEIYNHAELRRELEACGHAFHTRSDTEVLVHLFEDEGIGFLPRLHGMYAFAVTDGRRLLLARDPLGVKPLYYGWAGERLLFASELKALAPFTKRLHIFPPGAAVLLDGVPSAEAPLPVARHYEMPPAGRWEAIPWPDAVSRVRELVAAAVRERLAADAPVGVLLSGGLDSTLVAAFAREAAGAVDTFATGLPGSPDLDYAAAAAKWLGTRHHRAVYSRRDVIRALPEVVQALESFDPALVRSAAAMWFVARLAREYVKAVLSGEGADELFAGYASLEGLTGRALDEELRSLLSGLHWTNLQRADRICMAHGLEAREPFLDVRLVDFAFRLPWYYKRRPGEPGKRVLRAAAAGHVPEAVIRRPKAKFSQGTGTAEILRAYAEEAVTDADFARARRPDGSPFLSKEEFLYYRIFREVLPEEAAALAGRTRSVVSGEVGPEKAAGGAR
ncbi:MAG: asparagine synthase (glutamine-hydrolyzing) [Firmicutes bacterium]|nr:asparagine synthase (glutamine-hydrolyzing) [Bacillota bacterium]